MGATLEHWRKDPEEELARQLSRRELSTFWNSNIDLIVGPNETVVWIEDGKIADSMTQTRLQNVAGGFRNWLGAKMNTGKEVHMLVVDNKPFQIEVGVEGLTKDNVAQSGVSTLTLRLNSEQATLITGMLREKQIKVKRGFFRKKEVVEGYETVLTRSSIEQMISAEAQVKVFQPVIRNYLAADFGTSAVAGTVESAAQVELQKTLEMWGMTIENIFVSWNANAYQSWRATKAPTEWAKLAKREESLRDEQWVDEDRERARARKRKDKKADDTDDDEDQERARARKRKDKKADDTDELDDEDHQFDIEAKRRRRGKQRRQWAREDRAEDRTDEAEEAQHSEEIADLQTDKARSRKNKDADARIETEAKEAEQDREELEGLMGVKSQLHDQKMERLKLEKDAEVEKAKHDKETYKEGQRDQHKRDRELVEAVSGKSTSKKE